MARAASAAGVLLEDALLDQILSVTQGGVMEVVDATVKSKYA
jgi:hypothetical protein